MLPGRNRLAEGRKPSLAGLAIQTRCGERWCTDGIEDLAFDRTPIPAGLRAGDQEILDAPGWLERVLLPVAAPGSRFSVLEGQSDFSGGAHAQNELTCRTLDRNSGRELSLEALLGEAAAALQRASVQQRLQAEDRDPQWNGYGIEAAGLLLDAEGRVALCALPP